MVTPNTVALPSPTIDAAEARWAADELAGLLRRIGPDSVVGLVLRQAQQELRSLVGSADAEDRTVLGPFRLHRAA